MCGVTTDPEGMAHVRVSLRNERLCARVGCCGGTRELTLACRCGPGHLYVAECDGDYPPPCRYYAALGDVRGIGSIRVRDRKGHAPCAHPIAAAPFSRTRARPMPVVQHLRAGRRAHV